jgi:transposase
MRRARAPAPAHLVEGGIPTEALLAQVAAVPSGEHMPLYRQSQVLARRILIDRAVFWRTGWERSPSTSRRWSSA